MTHPAVVEVLDAPQPGEPDSGMLMLRLEGEQVIGIDPRLTKPAHTDEPEAAHATRVHRTVDVTSASNEAGEKDSETVMLLVRSVDYFVAQGQLVPATAGWLTKSTGPGPVVDEPTTFHVVSESDLPNDRITEYDTELQGRAVGNLRLVEEAMVFSGVGLEPDVLTLTTPSGNEAA